MVVVVVVVVVVDVVEVVDLVVDGTVELVLADVDVGDSLVGTGLVVGGGGGAVVCVVSRVDDSGFAVVGGSVRPTRTAGVEG